MNNGCYDLFLYIPDAPFPRNYQQTVKKILTRLFRVFVHVYIHHFDKMVGLGAVSLVVLLMHGHIVKIEATSSEHIFGYFTVSRTFLLFVNIGLHVKE